MTASLLPPGVLLIVGALVLPLLRGRLQAAATMALPALGLVQLLVLTEGTYRAIELFGYQLTLVRVDRLSLVFGYVFHLAAVLTALFSFHVRDTGQHVAGMVYVGSAIGVVFAGDLLTLFVYWEITAFASVFLIWARARETDSEVQRRHSYRAGLRYLVIQVGSGVLLLAGVLLHFRASGSLAFDRLIGADGALASATPGVLLIFLAFGIKCAFPFLHNWLQDAYPEATVTGTVFLSAFTTKLAVYALARGFPGTGILIWIGVTMTLFPVFYAVIENNLRRVLAYSLNNQLGFMVVGVGIGTPMALNGTAAHAFCHILYKALLFMSMGAVLHRTGRIEASRLGGLYKSMPITAVCCMIGAASISAFPLFSGFVAKSLVMTAAADSHNVTLWLGLLIASAGVMEHSGIKIPYFAFFGHDSGNRCKEAPRHMLAAMVVTAAMCVFLGCFPGPLYSILPFPQVEYHPYTAGHVLTQLQLLLFAALAFGVLVRTGVYPPEKRSVNLDFDWTYRRLFPRLAAAFRSLVHGVRESVLTVAGNALDAGVRRVRQLHGPGGILARPWAIEGLALAVALMLAGYLVLYFVLGA